MQILWFQQRCSTSNEQIQALPKKTLQVARKMPCLWLPEVFVVGRNYTYIYTQAPVVQNGKLKHNQARLITGTLWSFVAGTTEQVDATA